MKNKTVLLLFYFIVTMA